MDYKRSSRRSCWGALALTVVKRLLRLGRATKGWGVMRYYVLVCVGVAWVGRGRSDDTLVAPSFCGNLERSLTLPRSLRPFLLVLLARALSSTLFSQYMHSRGVCHADMSLENTLIDTDGRPYIMDFGMSLLMPIDTDGRRQDAQFTRCARRRPRLFRPRCRSCRAHRGRDENNSRPIELVNRNQRQFIVL